MFAWLVQGRNDMAIFTITRELGILTWDEAFLSLRCTLLPDAIRAKYCELIIGKSSSLAFLVYLSVWPSTSRVAVTWPWCHVRWTRSLRPPQFWRRGTVCCQDNSKNCGWILLNLGTWVDRGPEEGWLNLRRLVLRFWVVVKWRVAGGSAPPALGWSACCDWNATWPKTVMPNYDSRAMRCGRKTYSRY